MQRVLLALALATAAGCASMPAKQRATVDLRAVDTALSAAQDYERSHIGDLQLDSPASPELRSLCPITIATLPVNASKHNAVSCLFAVAFDAEIKAGAALTAWRAGDPVPANLIMLQNDLDQVIAVARQSTDRVSQQAFLDRLQSTVDAVLAVFRAVRGN